MHLFVERPLLFINRVDKSTDLEKLGPRNIRFKLKDLRINNPMSIN